MTESETSQQQQSDEKAAQAAFDASFAEDAVQATPAPTPEPTAAPQAESSAEVTEPETTTEAAQPAPSPSPTPAPYDAQGAIRKLQGQIGDLNSLLREQMKKKEETGKPATVTAVELKRMKEQFPELAEFLQEDLAESLASLTPAAVDPKQIQELIDQGVAQRLEVAMSQQREEAVTARHENWKTDLWNLETKERTADYAAWLKSQPQGFAEKFEGSTNPYFVTAQLDAFYDWRDKAAKAAKQKEERLKANLTPQGVPRAGQQSMSDDEALKKGFEEGFNS